MSSASFDVLPKELVLRIFSYLNIEELYKYVAPVCKEWLVLSNDPYLRLHLNFIQKKPPTHEVRSEILKCPVLRSVLLVKRNDVNCILKEIHLKCPVLRTISLHECLIEEKYINKIAPQLQEIIIGRGTNIQGDLSELFSKMSNLKQIHLLDQKCYLYRKLRPFLTLNAVSSLCIDSGSFLHDEDVSVIVSMKYINTLIIDAAGISENGLKMICCISSRLDKFGLCNSWMLTDSCLNLLSESLSWIRIHQCRRIHTQALKSLFRKCVKLQHVDLDDVFAVDDSVLEIIGISCKTLNLLGLSRCVNVTDNGVSFVLNHLKFLSILDLSWNTRIRGSFLSNFNKKLYSINFYLCINIPRYLLDKLKKDNSHIIIIGCAKPLPGEMVQELKNLAEITKLRTGSQRTEDEQLANLFRHPFSKFVK